MSSHYLKLTDTLHQYILDHSLRDNDVLQRLREETRREQSAGMQLGVEQGQLLGFLVKLMQASRTIEIGVFTGYSTLCTAMALPENGKIIACDINQRWTTIAQRYWREAGVDHKIDLRVAPAIQTLDSLIKDDHAGEYDFAFIDADKTAYDSYYEACLTLLRPGGLIVIDNVLWGGAVADASSNSEDTQALRALNAKLKDDERIELSMLAIGDGLSLALKK